MKLDYCLLLTSELLVFSEKVNNTYKDAEKGVFDGPSIEAGEVAQYLYVPLVYLDLHGRWHLKKTYGDGVIAGTHEQVALCVVKIPDPIVCRKKVDRTLWIDAAPFFCRWYINDTESFSTDKSTDKVKRLRRRQIIVSFVQIWTSANRSELNLFGIVGIS